METFSDIIHGTVCITCGVVIIAGALLLGGGWRFLDIELQMWHPFAIFAGMCLARLIPEVLS
jgi:hypothetical protein